jgi:hypothetical protein
VKAREKSRANPKNSCIETVVKSVSVKSYRWTASIAIKHVKALQFFAPQPKRKKTGIRR